MLLHLSSRGFIDLNKRLRRDVSHFVCTQISTPEAHIICWTSFKQPIFE